MTTTIIKAAAAKTSNHIGAVGDRLHIEGVIRKMFSGRSTVMYIIEDIDGNQFIINRKSRLGSKPGVLVTVEASVLEHRMFNNIKQTVVSSGAAMVVEDTHAFLLAGRAA